MSICYMYILFSAYNIATGGTLDAVEVVFLILSMGIVLGKKVVKKDKEIEKMNRKMKKRPREESVEPDDEDWIILGNDYKAKKGKEGEDLVAQQTARIRHKVFVLRNLILGDGDKTTEIDSVIISCAGIYVVEVKNMSAKVFGRVNDHSWTLKYPDEKTYTLYNPIKQNEGHINALNYALKEILPESSGNLFRSVIVFPDSSELTRVPDNNENRIILNSGNFANAIDESIREYKLSSRPALTSEQIQDIYQVLYPFTINSEDRKQQHIKNVGGDTPIVIKRKRKATIIQEKKKVVKRRKGPDNTGKVIGIIFLALVCIMMVSFMNDLFAALPF